MLMITMEKQMIGVKMMRSLESPVLVKVKKKKQNNNNRHGPAVCDDKIGAWSFTSKLQS